MTDTSAHEWKPGDFAEVGGMPVELLRRHGTLWQCARIFPKPGGKDRLLVDPDLLVPFGEVLP